MSNGTYHIRCKAPLTACLRHAEGLCPGVSYDVLAARDRRTYTGVEPAVVEHRSSEAVVECGSRGASLFSEPDLAKQVEASRERGEEDATHAGQSEADTRPESTKPPLACTPGLSQACVGIGGCHGGQACLEDGSGFGPCQCAPTARPAGDEATPGAGNPVKQTPNEDRHGAAAQSPENP